MAGERQQKAVHPVFEKITVGQALEERVPMVLVAIDEPRQNDAARCVNDLVEAFCIRHFRRWPDGSDFVAVCRNKAARINRAASINCDNESVFYQRTRHLPSSAASLYPK